MEVTDNKPVPYTSWSTTQVVNWLEGLDDVLEPYLARFSTERVDGRWLNSATPGELQRLGVLKVGHQMIIMDRIRQLQTQYTSFDSETLQTVLFRVFRSCASITAAVNALLSITGRQDSRDPDADSAYPGILGDIQDAISYVINCVLKLMTSVMNAVFWLERPPFIFQNDMILICQLLLQGAAFASHHTQMAISSQSNHYFTEMLNYIDAVRVHVEDMIQTFGDSIILTPCNMDLVQIRKPEDIDLGFHFYSTQNNVHVIASVQSESPAFRSGKVSKGDELVEINDQVIIGWQHCRVIELIRLHPKHITMRLRKRPSHATDFSGFPGGGRRHRVVNPHNLSPGVLSQQTRSGYLLSHTPRRRAALASQLPTEPLPSTLETSDPSITASVHPVPTDSPPASSSSSSSRYPSLKMTDSSHTDSNLPETPNISEPPVSILPTSAFAAVRMISSTPNTPIMAVRASAKRSNKKLSEPHLDNQSDIRDLLSTSQTFRSKAANDIDSFSAKSVSSLTSKSLFPWFFKTHRRTASGDSSLISFNRATHETVTCQSASRQLPDVPRCPPSTSVKLKAMDKRSRNRPSQVTSGDATPHRKGIFRSKRPNRRISCKQLGQGDCQGWLWLKKSNAIASKYVKRWCVFKPTTLYYYQNPENDTAEGVIEILGFTIAPASESKSGRFPFHIFNQWVRFIFASESESDRSKWMNVLGLAAIGLCSELQSSRIGGFYPGYLVDQKQHKPDEEYSTVNPPLHSVPSTSASVATSTGDSSLDKNLPNQYPSKQNTGPILISSTRASDGYVKAPSLSLRPRSDSGSDISISSVKSMSTHALSAPWRYPSTLTVTNFSESDNDPDDVSLSDPRTIGDPSKLSLLFDSDLRRMHSRAGLPPPIPKPRPSSTSPNPRGNLSSLSGPSEMSKSSASVTPSHVSVQPYASTEYLRRDSMSSSPMFGGRMRAAKFTISRNRKGRP